MIAKSLTSGHHRVFGEKAKPYLEKAFRLPDRLSEKDKLYINAWYAMANRVYPRAINAYRQVIAGHPLDVESYYRLGYTDYPLLDHAV
jgi:hypothetical protein